MKHLGDFLTKEATLTQRMRAPEYSSVEVRLGEFGEHSLKLDFFVGSPT